ncbi:MAG: hypothetical protein COA43_14540 [Robiginitomaculum sp.]|nr:MAG: hypothetical protein COA43_14540 [Robiginitomaculum sp.]
MTIADLLCNAHYRGNQTLLAEVLTVNRNTLRKYMTDIEGEFHFIRISGNGAIELYTNQTRSK